jgi:hypothetical protein
MAALPCRSGAEARFLVAQFRRQRFAEILRIEYLTDFDFGTAVKGARFIHSTASSRDLVWINQKPQTRFVVPLKGPGVTARSRRNI